jgi:arylformamidase
MRTRQYIDLSQPLGPATPVYTGTAPFATEVVETTEDTVSGRRALNCSRYGMGAHCGTHMDAPFHFYRGGRRISEIAIDQCCGSAVLIDVRQDISQGEIRYKALRPLESAIRECRKAVLHTGWWQRWGCADYFDDHPVVTADASKFLVDCNVELLGVDMPSPDRHPCPAHLGLLGADAVIVENLCHLDRVPSRVFEFYAVPLCIEGREASPVRAIAALEAA